jgi:ABC-type dipeptide/oligopeptide/nickel transport system permease subunit
MGLAAVGARNYMPDYWWTAIFPGLAIFVAVFGFNLLGDGLRDVFDPKGEALMTDAPARHPQLCT